MKSRSIRPLKAPWVQEAPLSGKAQLTVAPGEAVAGEFEWKRFPFAQE